MNRLFFVFGAVLALGTAPAAAADLAAGQQIYASECAQCHGRTGRGTAVFPTVRGKSAEFIAERLTQYRAGERVGPNSPLMIAAASDLSDPEIADVAAYIAASFE
jgi:cytochrome c553